MVRGEQESEWAAMTRVAELLGVGTPRTVRKWVRQGQVVGGERPGTPTEELAEVRRLNQGDPTEHRRFGAQQPDNSKGSHRR